MHNNPQENGPIEVSEILDSPYEVVFDENVREIAREFGVSGSTISIFDKDRVWFKARHGVLIDEIGNEQSISRGLLVNTKDLLVIENLGKSEKYKNHYAHAVAGLGFFACAALMTDDRKVIGALCVFDEVPYKPSPLQLSKLVEKAGVISHLLEKPTGRFVELIGRSSDEMGIVRKVSSVGDYGGFYANTASNYLYWNPANNRILNIKEDWCPLFNDLINPLFTPHFKANKDVLKLIDSIRLLIQNPEVSGYSRLFTFNFGLPRILYVNMIYHRNGDDVYVVLKNESRVVDLAKGDYGKRNFLKEVESLAKTGGWEYNFKNKEFQFSKNATKILGIKPVPTANFDSLHLGQKIQNLKTLENDFSEAIAERKEHSVIIAYKESHAAEKTIRINGAPVFKGDICERLVGTIQDISEDKANHDLLSILKTNVEHQVDFYKSLVNSSNIFILLLDKDGNLLFSNKPYNRIFAGVDENSELLGRHEPSFYSTENSEKIKKIISKCLENPRISFPLLLDREDAFSNNKLTKWDCCTIGSNTDGAPNVLFIGIDITELKKSKEKLLKLLDEVSKQNERFIEFGNIVNHNIHSQVANLQGLIQLIDLMKNPDEMSEYFEHLESTVKNLAEITSIVSTVLNIQNNKKPLLETIDIKKAIDNILNLFREDIVNLSVRVEVDIPEGLEVVSVRRYLESTMKELISNAIRFRSKNRNLHLTINAFKDSGRCTICFKDNGIGIDLLMYANRIFKLYETLIPFREFKGTGLYLSRVRIGAIGGNLKVDSLPDIGSTFSIELPDEES
ncbi:ATP-binding protein [Algoriphagus sp. Y33]|uniref:ATP-binding protein n=1 Tax=Algoriphagus sp. Y33 TaxID=2772483 RepID=UPI001783B34D|nr:ATP-binding protein [Algoriphagus sp. Y33]